MLLYDRQIVTQNVTKKKKRIGKPIRFIWYTIRGSNEMLGVKNVEKWRFIRTSRSDLPKELPKS